MAASLPIVTRHPDEHIVQLNDGHRLTVGEFLVQVNALTAALPPSAYAINLCRSRYHFLLAFCAAIVRGQTNLLPASRARAQLEELHGDYPQAYVLHDGEASSLTDSVDVKQIDIRAIIESVTESNTYADLAMVPDIPAEHLAAVVFTSGSTAKSKPIAKPWHTFVSSSQLNFRHMVGNSQETLNVLATVPGQHMYGLETSILLPLFFDLCVADAQPLFPKDVQNALNGLPEPRILVSSPAHFRALVHSGLAFPAVQRILSATAPLDTELAVKVEALFSKPDKDAVVCEIFGCSEVGSLAWRNPCFDTVWNLFDTMSLTPRFEEDEKADEKGADSIEGGLATLNVAHLPAPVALEDIVSLCGERQFHLMGRRGDLVNVAGKRGSLAQLNAILLATDGIVDGCVLVYSGEQASATGASLRGEQLAALVVSATANVNSIRETFRQHVDAALVPRPIYFVDALPRSENGKLPLAEVNAQFEKLRNSGRERPRSTVARG